MKKSLTDQVDSVKLVLNDSGLPISRMEYRPYGETWFEEGSSKNLPKYNSQELDRETGLYFYNARHYDAEIGRFVTADNVIDGEYTTQGWNRYSYCHGNPVRYKDPTGHDAENMVNEMLSNDITDAGSKMEAWMSDGMGPKEDSAKAGGTENANVAKSGSSAKGKGDSYKNQMKDNLKQGKDGNYYTKIGDTEVVISNQFYSNKEKAYEAINGMKEKTLGVLADMAKETDLKSVTITSLVRNSKPAHDEGRAIDITSAKSRDGKTARFRDMDDYKQPDEPELAKKMSQYLHKDKRINQAFSPWHVTDRVKGTGKFEPNKNYSDNEKAHKNHLHFGIWPD